MEARAAAKAGWAAALAILARAAAKAAVERVVAASTQSATQLQQRRSARRRRRGTSAEWNRGASSRVRTRDQRKCKRRGAWYTSPCCRINKLAIIKKLAREMRRTQIFLTLSDTAWHAAALHTCHAWGAVRLLLWPGWPCTVARARVPEVQLASNGSPQRRNAHTQLVRKVGDPPSHPSRDGIVCLRSRTDDRTTFSGRFCALGHAPESAPTKLHAPLWVLWFVLNKLLSQSC